jgi:tripartite-type tricarboxylate transporter receptor subunit TctC
MKTLQETATSPVHSSANLGLPIGGIEFAADVRAAILRAVAPLQESKMNSRRRFLRVAAGAAALPAVARFARAQAYPTRPVHLIAPFPPGGSIDITARLIGQWLTERLSQQVVIENRPGAGGNIGSETALNSPADGYTLLLCSVANAISATLYDKLNYDFRDVGPVAAISRAPNVMEVNPSVPAKTVPEFIAYAKANPGKVNMASSGVGTSIHLSGELFKLLTGVNMQHVPYRGSAPMLTDLLAGQVQIAFDNLQPSLPHIKAGALRALAVTTATRSEALPDLPTVGDFVPGYEASTWNGVCAPRNTPAEIVDLLNREINAGLADPNVEARLADMGAWALPGSPADCGKLIADEIEKWGKVIHAGNIRAG